MIFSWLKEYRYSGKTARRTYGMATRPEPEP
jgi:hypothetical protein